MNKVTFDVVNGFGKKVCVGQLGAACQGDFLQHYIENKVKLAE